MKPADITNKMMSADYFSQWLGIRILSVEKGYCKLGMTIRKEMLNGFGIAHGGISYSLADSALAFASNSQGVHSLSIETSISHIKSVTEGTEIIAEARCESDSNKLGHYRVTISSEKYPDTILALFKGIVYKTSRAWD